MDFTLQGSGLAAQGPWPLGGEAKLILETRHIARG